MQHLIIDSDDDFSIATSELSAWDSDVHSIRTLASCANSWAQAADFKAPALVTLRVMLLVTMVGHLCWATATPEACLQGLLIGGLEMRTHFLQEQCASVPQKPTA